MNLTLGFILSWNAFAMPASQAYWLRFQTYLHWKEQLPETPEPEFIAFINTDTPLANQLRQKWLYELARNKDWAIFSRYFRDTDNIPLQCLALTALYHLGDQKNALRLAKPIWLSGHSQPSECDELFQMLLNSPDFDENLITKRIALALEKRNLGLARYLLKQYQKPRLSDIKALNRIYHQPSHISKLEIDELHDDYYLYGLKRMVSLNMDEAVRYWRHAKTNKLLTEAQQQSFLAHISLYKAMRDHKDTRNWFAQMKPEFYNNALLNWQIRFALKNQKWDEVERLIRLTKDEDNPTWQYWLARALEKQKKTTQAQEIYEAVAKKRHYYGFLASLRLNQKFSFEVEQVNKNLTILEPYQPFIDEIKSLYTSHQTLKASRLINDFILELPKEEKSAFAWWLAKELNWHDKAIYIGNQEELNDQITLRFPLAYRQTISRYAKKYQILPEFIYAIIRQESTFRENVTSSAGALGLMQVRPSTAKNVSHRQGILYKDKQQLFSAKKNINIGAAYLHYLNERFDHHPVLVAAAYNAGPNQVKYWLQNHQPQQMDIWIETLPWHETRNYLQNVIAFYAVYQYLMNKSIDLSPFMKPLD